MSFMEIPISLPMVTLSREMNSPACGADNGAGISFRHQARHGNHRSHQGTDERAIDVDELH
jgi:hypothetical protein